MKSSGFHIFYGMDSAHEEIICEMALTESDVTDLKELKFQGGDRLLMRHKVRRLQLLLTAQPALEANAEPPGPSEQKAGFNVPSTKHTNQA